MRLYKKAAACLLTAAMAISMLTACGGGGNGGNGKTPVVTPTGIQTGDYTSGFMGMVVLFLSACASLAVTLRKKRA